MKVLDTNDKNKAKVHVKPVIKAQQDQKSNVCYAGSLFRDHKIVELQ